jgi:23S rRNA pseudouridine1911/1915/1917 synthase
MPTQNFTVAPEMAGMRLDTALPQYVTDLSRSQAQKLIENGNVLVNGEKPHKFGVRLEVGDMLVVQVPTATPMDVLAEALPLDVLYEDKQVLVINKQAGLSVHPAGGANTGTLVNAVLAHCPQIGEWGDALRPGMVHRLDKDTSGVIILAKSPQALRFLQAQFKARTVEKKYLALVVGTPPSENGRIEAAIGRDSRNRKRMAVFAEGQGRARSAITEYVVLQNLGDYSLLDITLLTGRTHQIRVHLAFLGCPVAGDRVYATRRSTQKVPSGLSRQFLHASQLMLQLPNKSEKMFHAPLPSDLLAVLNELELAGGLPILNNL